MAADYVVKDIALAEFGRRRRRSQSLEHGNSFVHGTGFNATATLPRDRPGRKMAKRWPDAIFLTKRRPLLANRQQSERR